jgi:hypothetical protein
MSTPLHQQIKQLAGPNPAVYLSKDFVNVLVVSRFTASIAKLAGVEFLLGDQRQIAATISSATFSNAPGTKAAFIPDPTNPNNDTILFKLRSDLTVVAKLYIKGKPAAALSTITVVISGVTVQGFYKDNALLFSGVNFTQTSRVDPDPDRDDHLRQAGLQDPQAAYVEGLVALGAIPQALRQTIGQNRTIDLFTLYPAFNLGKSAKLFPVENDPVNQGEYLAIVPADFSINQAATCSCAPGVALGTSQSTSTVVVPADPQNGPLAGQISIGGPIPQSIDPARDLGPRPGDRIGIAGVYMPRQTYEGLTVRVMPAIEVDASDNGFIGFDARGTVGFSKPAVSLDTVKGGVLLDFDMDISVNATCTLDMICFRLPIGRAIINPAPGSQAHLQMGFYPALDSDGNVKLKAILQKVDMGSYVAVVLGIGTALEVIGVTAWIGFLIDVVLSTIISIKLPSVLKDQVSKYLGNNEWVLLHFGDLIKETYGLRGRRFEAPFDLDADSFIAAVDYRG